MDQVLAKHTMHHAQQTTAQQLLFLPVQVQLQVQLQALFLPVQVQLQAQVSD